MPSLTQFQLSYQKSPITFVGGIANNLSNGTLPIISITQASSFGSGVTGNASAPLLLEDYLFDFYPMPGGQLANFDIGRYPFANQIIAANAIISEPLSLSVLMEAPVRTPGAWDTKLAAFTALQSAIQQHAALGGYYSVSTPSYLYQNLILLGLQDSSPGDKQRPQSQWVWTFIQPLLTLQQAQAAQNSLMLRLSGGLTTSANTTGSVAWSGQGPAIANPGSGQGGQTVPASQNLPTSLGGVSPPTGS